MLRPMPKTTTADGKDVFWYGANFWSRSGGPLMWRNYDPDLVRQELAVLAEHGLDMTRSFFYWPDFQPEPDVIDEQLCAHYADFLDAHAEHGMTTIPTFIVGHMSGENWDPAWRQGRDIYADVWMVGREVFYVTELTRRFHEHPAVSGWLISNEIPIYGGEGDRGVIEAWCRIMVSAVRAGGGTQPISIGDGAWGQEVTGHDSGFSVRDLAAITDFVGPHVYRMETDVVRQHLNAAFVCELAAVGGKPVVMEEFGLSTDFVSTENARHYYRQLLVNTLLAGSVGWIAWNNTDYDDIIGQRPYSHHPFELHFGITDRTGRPKSALLELQDFRRLVDRIDLPHLRRRDAEAALVVSSYVDSSYSFLDDVQPRMIVANAHQGYVSAKQAGLPVAVVREQTDGGIPDGARLYLFPSLKELTGPSWAQLVELADGGATVYVSYCAGESGFQRGPWWTCTEELFGVRNDLVYGLNNPVEDDEVVIAFSEDLGSIRAGEQLVVRAAGNENSRAFLPVVVTDGRVVATDQHGNPAVVVKEHGAGRAVLCTYPLEHFAARRRGANPEDSWRLYHALAGLAGAAAPVQVDDPRVLVDALVHDDGRELWFLVSQHGQAVEVAVACEDELTTLYGEPAGQTVHLDPYGYVVLVRAEGGTK